VKRVCEGEESTLVEAGLWRVKGKYKSDGIYPTNDPTSLSCRLGGMQRDKTEARFRASSDLMDETKTTWKVAHTKRRIASAPTVYIRRNQPWHASRCVCQVPVRCLHPSAPLELGQHARHVRS
jgi:hypothetical protein